MMDKRIVVGLDGSANAQAALDFAIQLAPALNAEIVAVFAVPAAVERRPDGRRILVRGLVNERRELDREFREEWCRSLKTSGVEFRAILETGDPAAVIAGVAARESALLVVVGRQGRGALAGLMLGSVSRELSNRSTLPVLLLSRSHASETHRSMTPNTRAASPPELRPSRPSR